MKREFSATKSIGDAFSFIKNYPWFVVKFFAFLAVSATIVQIFNTFSNWRDFNYFDNIFGATTKQTIQALMSWLATIWWPVAIIGFVLAILLTISIESMVFRKALFGKETGFLGLNLGKDELRLAAAKVVAISPMLVFYGLLGLAPILRDIHSLVLIAGTVSLALIAPAAMWVSLRLCQSAVVSQAKLKFDFSEFWQETKDNAWNIFGLQILWGLLISVISFPGSMLIYIILEAIGGNLGDMSLLSPLFSSLEELKAACATFLFTSMAMIVNILNSVSVYKQMNPDFAPISSNSPTEIP